MIALIVGILITIFGFAVTENAAFSDRAQKGIIISIFGAIIVILSVVHLIMDAIPETRRGAEVAPSTPLSVCTKSAKKRNITFFYILCDSYLVNSAKAGSSSLTAT